MKLPSIYLASASPRRRELLEQIAVDFSLLNISVDESVQENESATDYVSRIAIAKAQTGWNSLTSDARPVLGADTAVVLADQTILGKPRDQYQARQFLQELSGTPHQVMTAVAIIWKQQQLLSIQVNEVTFKTLSSAEIEWYLETGEGNDKAGGYAVQGFAAMFIESLNGSYSGVMGLPLFETSQLLQQVKMDL